MTDDNQPTEADDIQHTESDENQSTATDDNQLTMTDEITPDVVQPVIREGVIILGILGFIVLGLLLPGTGREIPGTAVAIGDLVIGIGTLGIVGSLLYAAPKLRELVVAALEGSSTIVSDAGAIVQYLVVFVAVLIAHQGFAPALVPLIGVGWGYDLAFFLFALVPLGVIAYRFYQSLDPLAQFLTTEILGTTTVQSTDPHVGDGEPE